jgi:hypothetical protein
MIDSVRVSLVQCPVWGVDDPPLGLAQMAGCVTHCTQEARVFDLNVRFWREAPADLRIYWDWDRLPFWNDAVWIDGLLSRTDALWDAYAVDILRSAPHAVAFSMAQGSQRLSFELARRIKRLDPKVAVILGGPLFTDHARVEEAVRSPDVDIVVAGVGEDLFPKMLGLYKSTGRWISLPGMVVKGSGSAVAGGRSIPYTFDLDIAPCMDFGGFDWSLYAKPGQMPASASRGCPSSCAYCSSREYWGKYSFKSGDLIFTDISRMRQTNPNASHIEFYDIMANGNIPSLVRFSEMACEHWTGRGLTWRINAAPRPEMTSAALASMAAGGCREIVYGLESGSASVLSRMNRPFAVQDAESALRATHEAGIRCTGSFIVGLPGETEEDFEETLKFAGRVRPWLDSVCVGASASEEPSLLARRPELFPSGSTSAEGRRKRFIDRTKDWGLPLSGHDFTIGDTTRPAAGSGLAARI